jgi:outer membrane protein assembly factor BamB
MKRRNSFGRWKLKGIICICSFILTTIFINTGVTRSRAEAGASPYTSSTGDWPTFMGTPGHSGYNANETIINPSTAPNLKLHWKRKAYKVSSQPAVVNGVVYWSSWDGNEHATKVNGSAIWTTNLGTTLGKCFPPQAGVAGTATITSAVINGSATSVLLVGGANSTFYALNAANGSVIWQMQLSTSTDSYIWGSPVVYNGSVYMRALDPATGNFIWQTCLTQGPVLGAVTVIPGIAVVTQGNTVSLIATDSGQVISSLLDTTTFSRYFASATVSNGMLYVGNMNGKFFAYGL